MKRFPKRGVYTGRLAFNPDTGYHMDDRGRHVVTHDGGRTWRYAKRSDLSHQGRYEQQKVTVESTHNFHLSVLGGHGPDEAERRTRVEHPHHYEVQDGDPHKDGLKHDPDAIAPFVTSHTDAWKELS